MTRVLITADQLQRAVPGGIGTYVRGLFSGLEGIDDIDPVAWVPRGPSESLKLAVKAHTSTLPAKLLSRAWDLNITGPPRAMDIDRIHATSLSIPGQSRRRIPMSCFIHDLGWRHEPAAYPPRGRAWHEASLHRALARCDHVMVPSRRTADDLIDAGVSSARIHVVAEGCDHLPAVRRSNDGGGTYLLSVSTLEPRKNLRRLVQAYSQARIAFSHPWPLRIVGPTGWGPQHDDLVDVEGVELVGRVTDLELAQLMAGARALAYVPTFEGFGLPVVEAMRAGVAVVASTMVPSATDGPEGVALLVDPTDTDSISRSLITILEDDYLRSDLVKTASAYAANLTWHRCGQHHARIWNESL